MGGFFVHNKGMTQKYTKELDQLAYRAIALGGIDRSAYETIGISDRTFYLWMAKHDSFRQSVEQAREFHLKASPDALRLALVAHIVTTLENGGDTVRINQRVCTRTVQRDRRNQVIFITELETFTETEEKRGLPKWIADKIMGNASNLNDAIAKVINAGYEVSEPARLNGHHTQN